MPVQAATLDHTLAFFGSTQGDVSRVPGPWLLYGMLFICFTAQAEGGVARTSRGLMTNIRHGNDHRWGLGLRSGGCDVHLVLKCVLVLG